MNRPDENQHWISRCLLKRFKLHGAPFQCFDVDTGNWAPKSLDSVCSAPGYNQLVVSGDTDNTLEAAFSAIESALPSALRAIDAAVSRKVTELPRPAYESLCWYLSFLKGTAPYSKPGAVVSFLFQLNLELENGHDSLLRELSFPDETIRELRIHRSMGRRVIIESENLLQLVYRLQFRRNYLYDYRSFLSTKWTVSNSPIELPISDVGMVPMFIESEAANHYLLPIRPDLLLEGILYHDPSRNSTLPVLTSLRLTDDEALYRFECICASAISELVCRQKITGIAEARSRASANGIKFPKIVDPRSITSSGLVDVGSGNLRFRVVPVEEYVKAVHAHMKPND
jgi:hypothetical protein